MTAKLDPAEKAHRAWLRKMPAAPPAQALYRFDWLSEAGIDVAERLERYTEQLQAAWSGRDWEHLGYPSWDEYAKQLEWAASFRLTTTLRQELVRTLLTHGMSQHAIAPAIGVSQATVSRDRAAIEAAAGDSPESPDPTAVTIRGRDGKEYKTTKRRARVTPEPAEPVVTLVATVTGAETEATEPIAVTVITELEPPAVIRDDLVSDDVAGTPCDAPASPETLNGQTVYPSADGNLFLSPRIRYGHEHPEARHTLPPPGFGDLARTVEGWTSEAGEWFSTDWPPDIATSFGNMTAAMREFERLAKRAAHARKAADR